MNNKHNCAKFYYPGSLFPETSVMRGPRQELIEKAIADSNVYAIQLGVEVRGITHFADGSTENVSRFEWEAGMIYMGGGVWPTKLLDDTTERILKANLERMDADYFVKTRCGNYQPFFPKKDEHVALYPDEKAGT